MLSMRNRTNCVNYIKSRKNRENNKNSDITFFNFDDLFHIRIVSALLVLDRGLCFIYLEQKIFDNQKVLC